jgi:hypothetical protein
LTKVPKISIGEKTASLTNVAGKIAYPQVKAETRSYFSPCTKIFPKWIRDLSIRPETLKSTQGKHCKI